MTEFAWDGHDEFGDQLANGTYLYRVWTSLGGDDIERRQTAVDSYFERGIGKMVLMR
jgi:flagellar hook assembly protein FlgD